MTKKFESGLVELGFETIPSPHPVVPLMVRDTAKTAKLVSFLHENGVLATGLNFPVVPKGDQLIRFQVSYDHTAADIDTVLDILKRSCEEIK
jgi:glycine C-acetyltransferase